MKSRLICLGILALLHASSCNNSLDISIEMPSDESTLINLPELTREEYHDKVLGALVGSAIGDAMGASTEMWHRSEIQEKFGYISGLTPITRTKSPEGIWRHNLKAGATTDDTRWKYLAGSYLLQDKKHITPEAFMTFIQSYYVQEVDELASKKSKSSTDLLDEQMEKVNWIKEWARVAQGYQEGQEEYLSVLNRFYGGEMSCAGLLYGPLFGLIEWHPEQAYTMAYDHALFDIGYAKDITALSAALTSLALSNQNLATVIDALKIIDPIGYTDSRLIGRIPISIVEESQKFVSAAFTKTLSDSSDISIPSGYPGDQLEWNQQNFIYQELEKKQKEIAFHSGEIWQIMIAGLIYGDSDFLKTMSFIVNYGRDNDTVAAIAGFILGAKLGYAELPDPIKSEIVKVSREDMKIDLQELAENISNRHYKN